MRKKLGKELDIINYFKILIGIKNEHERAVSELDKVIADKPDVAHFHYQKGDALLMMYCKNFSSKYKEELYVEIKKAVEMEPENTVYQYALGLLNGKLKDNLSLSL